MKKILMLATTAAMIEQFNKNNILILEGMGYEVHVAGNFLEGNPISSERLEEFKTWLGEHHGRWFHIPSVRRPLDAKNMAAYRQVIGLIQEHHYEFIHCHTPIGSIIGRLAARRTHTKVIYTAHGFHFYKGAPLRNWLLYFPAEWFCSWMTDVLITINREDFQFAKRYMHAGRTEYIPGVGIDLEKFNSGLIDIEEKRGSLGLASSDLMLLSVGELIERKNHKVVLRAIAELNMPEIRYFICGTGMLESELRELSARLGIEKQVSFLGFRTDISGLCQAADLFILPSRQEGLPVALMEAIACRTPVICSDIRGNMDLVKDKGCMFQPDDVGALVGCLREKMASSGNAGIRMAVHENMHTVVSQNYCRLKTYDLENVKDELVRLYEAGGGCHGY